MLKEGLALGSLLNEGFIEGQMLEEGIALGFADGGAVGLLDGGDEGNGVEGEELGKAVTSKSRQTSLVSQHTEQHLQTTSAGLSPSTSARQSEDISWIKEREEHRAFGTPPVRRFFSIDRFLNSRRNPS